MKSLILSLVGATALALALHAATPATDIHGDHINAHGGCVVRFDSLYYWYGEERPCGRGASEGVSCYRSANLTDWEPLGVVLAVSDSAGQLLQRGCIMERPKVVRCPATGRYVMWFHHEEAGRGYAAAQAGVAVADSPQGPFAPVHCGRVNPGVWPLDWPDSLRRADAPALADAGTEWWTPQWMRAVEQGLFTVRDHQGGQMARDQTIFVDHDGRGYHIYSSEENLTIHIAELTPDFTAHTGRYVRVNPGGHNEAPMLFRHGGSYWMITSGCTGWAPNQARLLRADSIMGPWERLPSPCRGTDADTTFGGQGTWVFAGPDGRLTAMFDRWRPDCLRLSGHLWLPIDLSGPTPVIYGE